MTRFFRTTLAAALTFGLVSIAGEAAKRPKHIPIPRPPVSAPEGLENNRAVFSGAHKEAVRAAWVQYGPSGILEARAVVAEGACPIIEVDLAFSLMQTRATKDANFRTVCSATLPAGAKQIALAFQISIPAAKNGEVRLEPLPLPLPVADPQRIIVFGDTGCRIKGKALQDCSDPEAWPFPRIAAEAARLKPDLVLHVGDYLYRENPCPAAFKGCSGTPFGDNWPTWDADFFAPAKPLLAAAPWVIVRGNHEDCQRAGPGFLRLLGPSAFDPAAPCADHLPQYVIPLAQMTLAVMDNANAPETSVVDKAVPAYREEIAALAKEKAPVWWLLHRPIWAPITGPLGIPIGGNLTMMAAVDPAGIPSPVELMLAGHIHTFQAINYDPEDHVPPQIVAGFGGDMLDPTPSSLRGSVFQGSSGVHVKDGLSIGGFGFLLMTRTEDGWIIDVHDPHGRIERQCSFRKGRVDCPAPRRR